MMKNEGLSLFDFPVTPTSIEIEVGGTPNAPTSALAAASGGAVTVSWSAPSSGYTPTGYTIYGSTDGGTTWTAVDEVDSTQTSDSLSGLTPSTSYLFHVTSTNDFGESAATAATMAITSPAVAASPTGLTATLTAGNVVLNWTAADALATGFNIYESTDGGSTFSFFDSVAPATASAAPPTTYTATGLTAGTTPQFYVTAENASGESAASSAVGFVAPAAPTGVTAILSSDDTSATISWTQVTNAIGYYVTRIPDDGTTAPTVLPEVTPGTTTHVTDTGLDPTAAYSWTVTAVYPTSIAISGGGSSGGSGSGGSGGGGSGGGSGGSDGSDGSSSGTGTGSSSDSSDDFTGTITGFTATVSGTTVNFTWSYQGSATFELEQEDQSDSGTNFAFVQGPTGRSASVGGLNPGDNYQFRIRADRSDGTVSGYATASASIAPTPPSTPSGYTLAQPTANVVTVTDEESGGDSPVNPNGVWDATIDVSAPRNSADPSNSDTYVDNAIYLGRQDDPLGVDSEGWDATVQVVSSISDGHGGQLVSVELGGTPGANYSFGLQIGDLDSEKGSPVSAPISVTLPGSMPTALSISAGSPDSSGNPTVTWSQPPGINMNGIDDGNTEDWGVQFYRIARENGKQVAISVGGGPLTNDQASLSNLAPGENTIFAVYFGYGDGYQIDGYAPYSNTVEVQTPGSQSAPAAPAAVTAVGLAEPDGDDKDEISWQNTPGGETGYLVQRSVDSEPFEDADSFGPDSTVEGGWTTIASTAADETTAADTNVTPGATYSYRVEAKNAAGLSGWSPLAAVAAPVTGPVSVIIEPEYLGADSTTTERAFSFVKKAVSTITGLGPVTKIITAAISIAKQGFAPTECQITYYAFVLVNTAAANGQISTSVQAFTWQLPWNQGPCRVDGGYDMGTGTSAQDQKKEYILADRQFADAFNSWLDTTFPTVKNIASYHISQTIQVPKPPWK